MKKISTVVAFFKGMDSVTAYQGFFLVRYLTSALLSVLIVRSPLAIQDVSFFELWLFFSTMLTSFWSNGIKNGYLASYSRKESLQGEALSLALFFLLQLLSVALLVLLLFASDSIWTLFTGQHDMPGKSWLFAYIVFSVPTIITENILFLRREVQQLQSYTVWSNAGQLVSVGLSVWLFGNVTSVFVAMACWSVVKWIYLVTILKWDYMGSIVWKGILPFFRYALPLIFLMLLGNGMELMDGVLVSRFFDSSVFPVYRYGARELPVSALLFTSLGAAMIPLIQQNGVVMTDLKARVTRYMHLLFPLSVLAILASETAFTWVYGAQYSEAGTVFAIYMTIISSRVLLPQVYQQAFHQHTILVISSVIELATNLVLSLWWMTLWGLFGLVAATVVAYSVQKLVLIVHNWVVNGIAPSAYIDLRVYAFYMFSLFIALFLNLFVL